MGMLPGLLGDPDPAEDSPWPAPVPPGGLPSGPSGGARVMLSSMDIWGKRLKFLGDHSDVPAHGVDVAGYSGCGYRS